MIKRFIDIGKVLRDQAASSNCGGRRRRAPERAAWTSAGYLHCQQLETRVLLSTLGSNWMAGVSNSMPLTQMSIPGTHDTMTGTTPFTESDLFALLNKPINDFIHDHIPDLLQDAYSALTLGFGDLREDLSNVADTIVDAAAFPSLPLVQNIAQTQDFTLQQQLDEGVRALDIRVQQNNDELIDVHGSLPIGNVKFVPDVMQVASDFLTQHPSETIVMQVQEDSVGQNNTEDFDTLFHQEIAPFSSQVWVPKPGEAVPATLGEARGKIIFIQSQWDPSNPSKAVDPLYPTPAIMNLDPSGSLLQGAPVASSQDDFATAHLGDKFAEAKATLDYAAAHLTGATAPSTFVANYLSTNDFGGILTTGDEALYPLPRFMATGNTVYFKVNLPTSIDGAIDDLTGDWIDINTASGPGMNSKVDDYINAEPRNAPTGIVFTDFADLQPGFVQDIYSHNPRISVNPVNIVYGTTLANSQLSGSASAIVNDQSVAVPGTFTYTSDAGKLLNAGLGQKESVTFTPNDLVDYQASVTTVTVNVIQASPTLAVTAGPLAVLGSGEKLTASAVLAGGFNETGSLLFVLQAPDGSTADTEFANVSGNGAYSTPTGYVPTVPGKYQWVALYFGDNNNNAAGTNLGDAPELALGRGVSVVDNELYLVGSDAADQLNIQHIGSSKTGSTGITVSGSLNGVKLTNPVFNPPPLGIYIILFNGTDSVSMESNLAIPVVVIDGDGNDSISLGNGINNVTVGNGNDQIQLGTGSNVVVAGNGSDTVSAGNGNGGDTVTAGNGNDSINLGNGNGNDLVTVGNGNDNIQVGIGNNTVMAGNGNDRIQAQNGNGSNTVTAGSGSDTINLGFGNGTDVVTVGSGKDQIQVGGGNNTVTAGSGSDSIQAGNGNNTITVGSGYDQIQAGSGNNLIVANTGAGQAFITLGNGNNTVTVIETSIGVANVRLGNGKNNVSLGGGNDQVQAGDGTNSVFAGDGNDTVNLGKGNFNSVLLGNGDDSVTTGDGSGEIVVVGNGHDTVHLGDGSNDIVLIGLGKDSVQIGKGSFNTVFVPLLGNSQTQIKFGPGTSNTIVKF